MRVGRPAANLYNLRVTSTARTAAQLITASRDPPGTLGLFLGTLADGLAPIVSPHSSHRDTPRAAHPDPSPPVATRSSKKF
jgi:hypothetical protein